MTDHGVTLPTPKLTLFRLGHVRRPSRMTCQQYEVKPGKILRATSSDPVSNPRPPPPVRPRVQPPSTPPRPTPCPTPVHPPPSDLYIHPSFVRPPTYL